MERKKKIVTKEMGVSIQWIDAKGQVKFSQHIPIADEYRVMKGYGACIKHLERHAWEIEEQIKYKGWLDNKRKK